MNQEDEEEKQLLEQIKKIVAFLIALFEALAYVWSGTYGEISDIGPIYALLIVIQLVAASVLV